MSPPEDVDILNLVSEGWLVDLDLQDLLNERQLKRLQKVDDFNDFAPLKNW